MMEYHQNWDNISFAFTSMVFLQMLQRLSTRFSYMKSVKAGNYYENEIHEKSIESVIFPNFLFLTTRAGGRDKIFIDQNLCYRLQIGFINNLLALESKSNSKNNCHLRNKIGWCQLLNLFYLLCQASI